MRTFKLLLLGIILFAGFASKAAAQTTEPPMFFLSVNIAGQAREQTFTETSTFAIYNETGASATTHVIGGGPLFDISAGARVWRDVGVAIGYTSFGDTDDAGITVRVPHPIIFGLPREETTTASGLKNSQKAVHLQFLWIKPYRDQFEVAFVHRPFLLYRSTGSGHRTSDRHRGSSAADPECHHHESEGQRHWHQYRRRRDLSDHQSPGTFVRA